MIVWIAIAVSVILGIAAAVNRKSYYYDLGDRIGAFFGVAGISAVIGAVVTFIIFWIPATQAYSYTEATKPLVALDTSSQQAGQFFLGTGSMNNKRTLNFIRQEEGYVKLDYSLAEDSRIFEGSEKATFTEYIWSYDNPWVLPWTWRTGYSYDFHVPEGTVQGDYNITNE